MTKKYVLSPSPLFRLLQPTTIWAPQVSRRFERQRALEVTIALTLLLGGCSHGVNTKTADLEVVGSIGSPGGYGREYQISSTVRSLVHIEIWTTAQTELAPKTGTGFIVSVSGASAYVVTAAHVIRHETEVTRIRIEGDGVETVDVADPRLVIVSELPEEDLALLRLSARPNAVAVRLEHPEKSAAGFRDTVALGYARVGGTGHRPPVSQAAGSLSWNTRENGRRLLVSNADLLPSMSGGPVLSFRTKAVVGVIRGRGIAGDEGWVAPISGLEAALREKANVRLLRDATPYGLPPLPSHFVRRPDREDAVHAMLNAPTTPFVVITGDGGSGKSVLAVAVARERLDGSSNRPELGSGYPDGVYFVPFQDRAEVEVLAELYFGVTGERPSSSMPEELARDVSDAFSGKQALVILDDLRGKDLPTLVRRALAEVPVLATSRRRYRAPDVGVIELIDLTPREARTLLRNIVGEALGDTHADALADLLGRRPLALSIAAAAMRQLKIPAPTMLARLRAPNGLVEELQGSVPVLRENVSHRSVLEAYLVSWNMLSLAEREALAAIAELADAKVPRALANAAVGGSKPHVLLDALVGLNLASYDNDESVTLHPLIHELTRHASKNRSEYEGARARIEAHLNEVGRRPFEQTLHRAYGPHVVEWIVRRAPSDFLAAEQILLHWHDVLGWSGQWNELIEAWDHVLRGARESRNDEQLALALRFKSVALSDVGQREEAVSSAQEAVILYRRLVEGRAEAFLPYLGTSLNSLSLNLSKLGRREEALDIAREAVSLYRRMAEARPETFLPEVARGLNNVSINLTALGRREEALDAAQESVSIYRRFAVSSGAFLPELALGLDNLGTYLSELGRPEDALAAAQEALRLRRYLVKTNDGLFISDLAMNLTNLSTTMRKLGHLEGALTAAQESVALYRQLVETRREAFLPNFAFGLNNLGAILGEFGRHKEAANTAQVAVALYRQLVVKRPQAHLPELAISLSTLSVSLSALGYREEAVRTAGESAALYRRLADDRPERYFSDLALTLFNLGVMLWEFDRREDALAASQQSVRLREQLSAERPQVFLPDLADGLNNLAVMLVGSPGTELEFAL